MPVLGFVHCVFNLTLSSFTLALAIANHQSQASDCPNRESQMANHKSPFTNLLPAASVRPRLMKLAEEDLEELVMELVKAVVGPLEKLEIVLLAEASHRQVVNRQANHPLVAALAQLARSLLAEGLENLCSQPLGLVGFHRPA